MPWRGKTSKSNGWESSGSRPFNQTYATAETYYYGGTSLAIAESPQKPQLAPVKVLTPPKSRAEHRVDGIAVDQSRFVSLHLAAAMGNVELVSFALQRGERIDSIFNGILPLHAAASGGDKATVRLLLQCGAEVDAKRQRTNSDQQDRKGGSGAEGSTALHFAAANGHVDVVNMLIQYGAAPDVVDHDGVTAEMLAMAHQHLSIASLLRSKTPNMDLSLEDESFFILAETSQAMIRAASCDPMKGNSSPLHVLRHKFSHEQLSTTAEDVRTSIRNTSKQAMSKVASNPTLRAAFTRSSNENTKGEARGKSSPPLMLSPVRSPSTYQQWHSVPTLRDQNGREEFAGNISLDSLTSSDGRNASPGSKLRAIRKQSSRTLRSIRSLGKLSKRAALGDQSEDGGASAYMDVIMSRGAPELREPPNNTGLADQVQSAQRNSTSSITDTFVGLSDQRYAEQTSNHSFMFAEMQETQTTVYKNEDNDKFHQDDVQEHLIPGHDFNPSQESLISCDAPRSAGSLSTDGMRVCTPPSNPTANERGQPKAQTDLSAEWIGKTFLTAQHPSSDNDDSSMVHTRSASGFGEDSLRGQYDSDDHRDAVLKGGFRNFRNLQGSPSTMPLHTAWEPLAEEALANEIFGQSFKAPSSPLNESHLRPTSVRSGSFARGELFDVGGVATPRDVDDISKSNIEHHFASGHTATPESPLAMLSADESHHILDDGTCFVRSGGSTTFTTADNDSTRGMNASSGSEQQQWAFADGVLGGESGNDPSDRMRIEWQNFDFGHHRPRVDHSTGLADRREFTSPSTSPSTPSRGGNARSRERGNTFDSAQSSSRLPRSRSLLNLLSRSRSPTLVMRPSIGDVLEKTATLSEMQDQSRSAITEKKNRGLKSLLKSVKGAVGVS